ncbi:MAG: hypothetical protein MJA29_10050 [Candidatus Omnitrophica bacterium]|nr:hypothetical protein [Candidatus Omnitrophota bacterium]
MPKKLPDEDLKEVISALETIDETLNNNPDGCEQAKKHINNARLALMSQENSRILHVEPESVGIRRLCYSMITSR